VPYDDITYYITIQSSDNKCRGFDTVHIEVLDGFKLNNIDTAICEGEGINVNATGDSRYQYTWTGASAISDISVLNPTITPGGIGKWTYKITATHEKCKDSTAEFEIEVQPIPEVTAPDDKIVCYADTVHLMGTVTPPYAYTYNWSPGQALNNPDKIDPVFTAYNTTTLTFKATTSAGCKDEDEVLLTALPSDFMEAADVAICPGDTAQLHLTGTDLTSFIWAKNADGTMSDIKSQDPLVYPDVTSVYTAFGVDKYGCNDTQIAKVWVKPAALLDLPGSVTLYPGESYQMRPGGNGITYSWFPHVGLNDPNIANPVAKPEVNTRYIVTSKTENGCSVTDSIEVLIAPDSYIDVPNAFAPGGKNTLKAVRLGDATLKSFVIYNRWGNKVFETSDINIGWDGKYKENAQPTGVYVYTIEAVTPAGRKFTKQGNVTMLR
jgi:gliding motility-associated-like protein